MARLRARYGDVGMENAEVVVALGGDGLMLQTLHRVMDRTIPVFGMNCGSVGFLMNDYSDEQLRALFAGNARRIMAGEAALEPTRPVGDDSFVQPLTFARIHQYLSMATPLLWTRQSDTIGVLGLALNTCNEQNGKLEELDDIRELLTAARDVWRTLPEAEEHERPTTIRSTFRLIHIAQILAVTSGG